MAIDGCTSDVCLPDTWYLDCPCPHGYKEGDTWSAGIRCGGCSCHANGWNCVTCARSDQGLRVDCYEIYNPNASFPDCCPTRVCKGYENFNQTQLDLFGK
uniref:Single domain-containing protein n=1 Tax=Magallana gigas TaxID=29159 RepID=K1Q952_MAGGI